MPLISKTGFSRSSILALCLLVVINGFGVIYLFQNYQWGKLLDQQFSDQAISLALGITHSLTDRQLTKNEYQRLANTLVNAESIDAVLFSNSKGEIIARAGIQGPALPSLAKQDNNPVFQTSHEQRLYVSVPIGHNMNRPATQPSQETIDSPRLLIGVSSIKLTQHKSDLNWLMAISACLLVMANILIFIWFRSSRKLTMGIEPDQILQQKYNVGHRQLEQSIELQKQAAITAQQEATRTSELKSQFIANMSHEIRTPLNAIVGFTDLLLKTDLTQRQHDFLANIKRSSQGLLQIINDILDFSKLEAGKVSLDIQSVNLRNIIEDALVQLAPAAHEKQLELIPIIYPDTPVRIQADPKRLGQILTNLISNAIKFTHKGSIVVRVNNEKKQGEIPVIKISVSDTGIGISESQQKRLFTAFTQADTSSTRQYEGTGLGLVIARQLSEQMHGTMGVESRINHGSNFWFTFEAKPSSEQPEFNTEVFRNHKVFIYDSYPLSRLSMQNTLSRWGIKVSSTNHLEQLEAFVSENKTLSHHSNVIINLDFSSSKTDAIFHLIGRLKKQYQCPVIVLYNSSSDYDESTVLQASLSLAKPVRHEALYQALRQLTDTTGTSPVFQPADVRRIFSDHSPRVLAVDDNLANLRLAESLFQEIGADITCADSGKRALECLAKDSYDAIFMDIQMPEMDGVEVTQLIRSQPSAYRDIPIIALTAHALESEKKQWLASGIDDYLSKPVTEDQLIDALLRWTNAQVTETHTSEKITGPNKIINRGQDELTKIVDIEMGIRLAGGKPELAKELFDMLLANLDNDALTIKSASSSESQDKLLKHVHHLNGATRYCGVPALQKAAQRLEMIIKNKDIGNQNNALAQLLAEISRLQGWAKKNQWSTSLQQGL